MVVISKIFRFLPLLFPIVFGVAVINTTILQEFTFPSDDLKVTGDEKIDIPNSVFVSGEY
jgi:cell division septal protein FtsQ